MALLSISPQCAAGSFRRKLEVMGQNARTGYARLPPNNLQGDQDDVTSRFL